MALAQTTIERKRRELRTLTHGPALVDAIGVRRRAQALACLGWSQHEMSRRLGYKRKYLGSLMSRRQKVSREVHDAMVRLYDELSMTAAPTVTADQKRQATLARRSARLGGWASPLAWDDIDRDPEPADLSHLERMAA